MSESEIDEHDHAADEEDMYGPEDDRFGHKGVRPDIDLDELGVEDVSVSDEPVLEDYEQMIEEGEGVEFDTPDDYLPVDWVPRGDVEPNDWNPYYITDDRYPQLLASITDNGWTQPIVVREADEDTDAEYQIVDGEQRWTVAGDDRVQSDDDLTPPDVPAGHVPIFNVSLDDVQARISTMQHNINVGRHNMMKLGDLLEELEEEDLGGALAQRAGFDKFDINNLKQAASSELPDTPSPEEYFDFPGDEREGNMTDAYRLSLHITGEQVDLLENLFTSELYVDAFIATLQYAKENPELLEEMEEVNVNGT